MSVFWLGVGRLFVGYRVDSQLNIYTMYNLLISDDILCFIYLIIFRTKKSSMKSNNKEVKG